MDGLHEALMEIATMPKVKSSTEIPSLLDIAKQLTSQDRREKYGPPDENFRRISAFWNLWLECKEEDKEITAKDIPVLMILLKVARESHAHSRDNFIDIAGYCKTADELWGGQ